MISARLDNIIMTNKLKLELKQLDNRINKLYRKEPYSDMIKDRIQWLKKTEKTILEIKTKHPHSTLQLKNLEGLKKLLEDQISDLEH